MSISFLNEQQVAKAFTKQSISFDAEYAPNPIIQYKRDRVRAHVLQYLLPKSKILELNSGTGEDALFFARGGHQVHATDISSGMQDVLFQKIAAAQLQDKISQERCSFHDLKTMTQKGSYDLIFSNFGGLNCTGNLDDVLKSFNCLVKPGGFVSLVIIPPFCLWETLLFFKGEFKTATRRFFSKSGRDATIEGTKFTCWYYTPGYVRKALQPGFEVLAVEGLCTLVPPSYRENFPQKKPRLFKLLMTLENKWKRIWPWRLIGDYFIITFRKKS